MRWLPASLAARLSSRTLLATGLTSIVICALLMADMLGLVPDRAQAQREGRVALAESIALSSALFAAQGDADTLERYLGTVTSRSTQLTGVRLRSSDGSFLVEAGAPPADTAEPDPTTASTDTRVVVPVLGPQGPWGHVELHFVPLSMLAAWAPWLPQGAPLALCLALFCTLTFYLYLKRMLRHLDPSNVIPERVRTAFDTLAEGLLVLDPQGNIVLANKAFATVLGVDAAELAGRNAASLPWQTDAGTEGSGSEVSPAPELPWLAAQADGQLRYGTALKLPLAGGGLRSFKVNSSPIPGGGKSPAGVLVSLDDVTELQQKEIELRQARDAAQQANQAKSDFLANMSHEIRTPMNAILGFTDVLRRRGRTVAQAAQDPQNPQRAAPDTEAQRYLDIIHGSGKHLLMLINDILDLSKVEAGHLEIERSACAVHTVAHEVVQIMQVKAEEKGIGLTLHIDGQLPMQVHTDAARVRQILTNLIGNAIKFTAWGQVRVSLSMAGAGASHRSSGVKTPAHTLCIDVADSGIGIPANRLEAIFEPFVQAESSTTRQFGGTGLGLTISRRFARALGGDVRASSEPGRGSVFHLTLDAGDLSNEAWQDADTLLASLKHGATSATPATALGHWHFEPHRVLVVDDGAENRELVRLVLEEAGLQVLQAQDGQVALAMVEQHQPAMVLMDIQMPVMDGHTATRLLRERGFKSPVLALTANAMKGFEDQLQSNGFTGHLTKPIDIEVLLQTLATYLGGKRQAGPPRAVQGELAHPPLLTEVVLAPTAEPTRAEPTKAEPTAAKPVVQGAVPARAALPPIESRLAGHPRLAQVARSFCTQLPDKLGSMAKALDADDFQTLEGLAHWLKGAGGSVGYDAMFEPSLELENAAKAKDAARSRQALADLQAMAERIVAPPAAATPSKHPVPA
jgi:signal transduction histidine kinase/CheY-like chemotaxis protein/HPt (histidine-containing phosphotransfer) domain-containing protein